MVERVTFLQDGRKEVIRFIAAPQLYPTPEDAISDLRHAVRAYTASCGQGYNEYHAVDNPFVTLIIHGINE